MARDGRPHARRSRPGRPRRGEGEARRAAVLDAAFELLVERGYAGCTTSAIAQRAGASKETLYSWFGDKAGLFAALIERQAEATNARVQAALAGDGDVRTTLTDFAGGLLRLLLGERSVAINRAAIAELSTAPELAQRLLAHGRHRTGPLVESYLARQARLGRLRVDDPADAFRLLYGLIVQDSQIRVLLGEPPLGPAAITERAATAVDQFLTLTAPTDRRSPDSHT